MSYTHGFEDAMELCLNILNSTEDLDGVRERVDYYLALAKEKKFEEVKRHLGALR